LFPVNRAAVRSDDWTFGYHLASADRDAPGPLRPAPPSVMFEFSLCHRRLPYNEFMPVEIDVNGTRHRIGADPETSLLAILRENLDLTGAKYGCGEGQCGACTVLVDGQPKRSCVTPLSSVAGKSITTIEGLAANGRLHPLQEAFLEAEAMQCGYCTPGMILSGVALLAKEPNPDSAAIIRHLEGNLCRCGTYPRIVQAVRHAARAMAASGGRP